MPLPAPPSLTPTPKKRISESFAVYAATVALVSLILEIPGRDGYLLGYIAELIKFALLLPVLAPLLVSGFWFIPGLLEVASFLYPRSGSFPPNVFSSLAIGLFWGGGFIYPAVMFARTKNTKYIGCLLFLGIYVLFVYFMAASFLLMMGNSGFIHSN